MDKTLSKIYNDPSNPAGFAGVEPLHREARKADKTISREDVENFLQGHRTYTLMRPRRVHFPRVKTFASGFMTDVQVDLADMQALANDNQGNRYMLVAIDVLSKRLFVVPVKTKRAEDMVTAFEQLIKQMPMKPMTIYSDLGTEFKNRLMREWFEKEDIQKHEASSTYQKAAVAERAIQNLKQRLYRYFAEKQTHNWTGVLPQIVNAINHSKSRVHGMRPVDVNFDNAQQVWERIYGNEYGRHKTKRKFSKGDFVRLSRGKGKFEKGYYTNWGDEILEVDAIKKQSHPIVYKIKDDRGEQFKENFYEQELTKVRKDAETSYRIQEVLRKKKRRDGTYDMLVKFIGYTEPEWIHESQLV